MNSSFPSKRAPVFADVPAEKWNDWRWQLSHRLNSVEEIEKIIPLSDSEKKALNAPHLFRVEVTPYFISLIDPDDPDDPVRKQIIPTDLEMQPFTAEMEDDLDEIPSGRMAGASWSSVAGATSAFESILFGGREPTADAVESLKRAVAAVAA